MPAGADILLLCRCRYYGQLAPAGRVDELRAALSGSGLQVVEVDDLCELAQRKDPLLKRALSAGRGAVAACFSRAVRCLLAYAGVEPGADTRFFNLRTQGPAEILAALGLTGQPGRLPPAVEHVASAGPWTPWFPVIDYDRCRACGECLNFCLFGVYGRQEGGRVEVRQPASCKTNCPACARVCPHGAILFPKHPAGPINGDDSALPAGGAQGAGAAELKQVVSSDDLYAALRRRSQSRFATEEEAQSAVQKALQERTKCSRGQGLASPGPDAPPASPTDAAPGGQ